MREVGVPAWSEERKGMEKRFRRRMGIPLDEEVVWKGNASSPSGLGPKGRATEHPGWGVGRE